MNDQLLMDNYLLILKSTVEVFVHGTLESSNQDVRELLKHGLDEIMSAQARTYDEMINHNWYQTKNIDQSTIEQTLNTIKQKEQ